MRRIRGFSLIELMIAMVLGLLVAGALVSMFVGVRTASRTTSGVGALSDSGRFALNTIEQAVRGAGGMACNSTAPVSVAGTAVVRQISLLNPDGESPLTTDYGEPLSGYEAVGSSPGDTVMVSATPAAETDPTQWVTTPVLGPGLDSALINPPLPQGMAAPIGSMVAGSDVLVVHGTAVGVTPAYTTTDATGAGAFTISSGSVFSSNGGQIGIISNCVQTEVFQVAGFTPGDGSGIVALSGDAFSPGNSTGALSSNVDFTIGSQVAPVDSIVFYIGIGADGDGALYKYETNGGVFGDSYSVNEELVPDVENMQILYGVETAESATTQTVAEYVTADQVANDSLTGDFNGVISVKIALLVASPPTAVPQPAAGAASPVPGMCTPTPGVLPCLEGTSWQMATADSRLRKVYEQTMFLRDMSP